MNTLTALGLLAGTLTTFGFVPQVMKTWRTKSGADLSFGTFSTLFCGAGLWLTYGILREDPALIAANGLAIVLQGLVLGLMLRYRRQQKQGRSPAAEPHAA